MQRVVCYYSLQYPNGACGDTAVCKVACISMANVYRDGHASPPLAAGLDAACHIASAQYGATTVVPPCRLKKASNQKIAPKTSHPDTPDAPLNEAAKRKVNKYRNSFAASNHSISFLPAIT